MFDQKILCIGNETQQTHDMVTELAHQNLCVNHGLISSADNFVAQQPGFYHTSIQDVSTGDICLKLAEHFDEIVMLDQEISTYPHWKSFVQTFRLMIDLESKGFPTRFRNNQFNRHIIYWYDLLRSNRSLCVYPFINLINDYGSAVQCQKQDMPVTKIESIQDWSTDPAFAPIRKNMLTGQQMPDRCGRCYERETLGQESARQFESLEWAMELGLTNEHELEKITSPVLYEIRPSNKCNIMCRMCDDKHSHLIERENKLLGIPVQTDQYRMQNFPYERIDFHKVKRIYWAGGEPTVMPEFYEFLRRCIRQGHTDFYLSIGTNAQKISDTLWDLLKKFSNVNFSVSFDGYRRVNDYIRWGSDFDTIRANCFKVLEQGHQLAFQTVFSMYNATRIHEVYEFYDRDFPGCNTLVQPAGIVNNPLGPWNHPLKAQVLESMYKCRQTKVYHNNGRNSDSLVEEMIARYENYDYDPKVLAEFFNYNDRLDQARGTVLKNYIPELEQAREWAIA